MPKAQALLIQQVSCNIENKHHEFRSWLAIRAALDEWAACSHQEDASARSLDGPAPARGPAETACPSASLASQAILPALQMQACTKEKAKYIINFFSTDNKVQTMRK